MKTLIFALILLPGIASAQGAFQIIDSPPQRSVFDGRVLPPSPSVIIVQQGQQQSGIFPDQTQQRVNKLLDQQYDINAQYLYEQRSRAQFDSLMDSYAEAFADMKKR